MPSDPFDPKPWMNLPLSDSIESISRPPDDCTYERFSAVTGLMSRIEAEAIREMEEELRTLYSRSSMIAVISGLILTAMTSALTNYISKANVGNPYFFMAENWWTFIPFILVILALINALYVISPTTWLILPSSSKLTVDIEKNVGEIYPDEDAELIFAHYLRTRRMLTLRKMLNKIHALQAATWLLILATLIGCWMIVFGIASSGLENYWKTRGNAQKSSNQERPTNKSLSSGHKTIAPK